MSLEKHPNSLLGSPSDEGNMSNSPFLCTYDDMSLLESGLYRRTHSYSNMGEGDNHPRKEEETRNFGKPSLDPRSLALLMFFSEVYVRRKELLKKISPGPCNEIVEFMEKVAKIVSGFVSGHMKVKTMQRSLSVGSPRTPSSREEDESPMRLERFKVRIVNQGGGETGQGSSDKGGELETGQLDPKNKTV